MRVLPLLLVAACGSTTGDLLPRVWAEETVTDGFAAADTDGWEVSFDSWITTIGGVTLTDPADGAAIASDDGLYAVEWKGAAEPIALTALSAPAGRSQFGFIIAPATDAVTNLGADADAVAEMVDAGWSHLVSGQGTKDGVTKTFHLGFDLDLAYENCENGADGSEGVVINAGETTQADVYVHADHMLWDQLGTEEAALAFQAWADADADADGVITADELAAVDIATIGYEATGIDVANLWEFVAFSMSIMGHLNGEGECLARAR